MNIEKPTLAEKQDFWAEQLPIFKEHYIMQAQLDVLYFDDQSGNFEIKDESAIEFEKEDFLEVYHSVNTGWSMWLRATTFAIAKLEGCVVVPVEPTQKMIDAAQEKTPHFHHGDSWYGTEEISEGQAEACYKAMVEAARSGK